MASGYLRRRLTDDVLAQSVGFDAFHQLVVTEAICHEDEMTSFAPVSSHDVLKLSDTGGLRRCGSFSPTIGNDDAVDSQENDFFYIRLRGDASLLDVWLPLPSWVMCYLMKSHAWS